MERQKKLKNINLEHSYRNKTLTGSFSRLPLDVLSSMTSGWIQQGGDGETSSFQNWKELNFLTKFSSVWAKKKKKGQQFWNFSTFPSRSGAPDPHVTYKKEIEYKWVISMKLQDLESLPAYFPQSRSPDEFRAPFENLPNMCRYIE